MKRSRGFVTHIFWPDTDENVLNTGGFLVGWNLRNFRCCIAAVVTGMPLESVEAVLRGVIAKEGAIAGGIDDCKYHPVVLGEWVARLGEDTDLHADTKRAASLWVTLIGPCSQVGCSESDASRKEVGNSSVHMSRAMGRVNMGVPKLHSLYSNGCSYGGSECVFLCYSPKILSRCSAVAPSMKDHWNDWAATQYHLSRALQLQQQFRKQDVSLLAELALCARGAPVLTTCVPVSSLSTLNPILHNLRRYSDVVDAVASWLVPSPDGSAASKGGWNLRFVVAVVVDLTLGLVLAYALSFKGPGVVDSVYEYSHKHVLVRAISALEAIEQAPMGIKFDPQLSARLTQLFSVALRVWFRLLYLPAAKILVRGLVVCGALGLRMQVGLLSDVLRAVFFPLTCIANILHSCLEVQLRCIKSLLYLFQGLKINILRQRVDSLECDRYQLLLGTATLVILVFLLPTFLIYVLFFRMVGWAVQLFTRGLLWAMVVLKGLLEPGRSEMALEKVELRSGGDVGPQQIQGIHMPSLRPLSSHWSHMRSARRDLSRGSVYGFGGAGDSFSDVRGGTTTTTIPISTTSPTRFRNGPAMFDIVVQRQNLR